MKVKDFELMVLITLILLGSIFLWFSLDASIPALYNKEYIKPYSVPNAIIVLLLIGCIGVVLQNLNRRFKEKKDSDKSAISSTTKDSISIVPTARRKILITSLLITLYVLSWPLLGFLLSTFIFVFIASMVLPTKKSIYISLVAAIGTVILCYVFFIGLFSINLPTLL